jgi:hypothetical protein
MGIDLEVQVLPELGHRDRSDPQGVRREVGAESSGERNPWADEQKPDMRRDGPGRAGLERQSSRDPRSMV